MGWSAAYLNRLLKGQSAMGIEPVKTLVSNIPELNARWLITGEGEMLTPNTRNVLLLAMTFEKYFPVMTPEEQQRLLAGEMNFDLHDIQRWDALLEQQRTSLASIFSNAYQQTSTEPCRTKTASL